MIFQVKAIPTIYGVKNGKVVDSFTGVKDDDELRAFVEKLKDS